MLVQIALAALLTPYYRSIPIWRRGTQEASVAIAREDPSVGGGSRATMAKDSPPAEAEDDPRRYWTEAQISITDMAFLAAVPLAFIWLATQFPPSCPAFRRCSG